MTSTYNNNVQKKQAKLIIIPFTDMYRKSKSTDQQGNGYPRGHPTVIHKVMTMGTSGNVERAHPRNWENSSF